MERENLGKIINVGSGFEISIKELIKLISEISGKKNFKLKIDNKKIRPKIVKYLDCYAKMI